MHSNLWDQKEPYICELLWNRPPFCMARPSHSSSRSPSLCIFRAPLCYLRSLGVHDRPNGQAGPLTVASPAH